MAEQAFKTKEEYDAWKRGEKPADKEASQPTERGGQLVTSQAQQSSVPMESPATYSILTQETKEIAMLAAQSGMFKDVKSMAQGCMKIVFGAEYGMSPAQSLNNLYIINGRVGMYADGMSDKLFAVPGLDVVPIHLDDQMCELELRYNNEPVSCSPPSRAKYTIEQAAKAGLTKKDTWMADAESQLFARALSRLYKRWGKRFVTIPSDTVEELRDVRWKEQSEEEVDKQNQIIASAGTRRKRGPINPDLAAQALAEEIHDCTTVETPSTESSEDLQSVEAQPDTDASVQDALTGKEKTKPSRSNSKTKVVPLSQPEQQSVTIETAEQPSGPNLTLVPTPPEMPTKLEMNMLLDAAKQSGWPPDLLVDYICKTYDTTPGRMQTEFHKARYAETLAHVQNHKRKD